MSLSDRAVKFFTVAAAILVWNGGALAGPADPNGCKAPETGTVHAPILSPPLGKVVVGKGRLQFFSAPDAKCQMNGVFVIPRDSLVAYAQTDDGWTSVMYMSSGLQGWVR